MLNLDTTNLPLSPSSWQAFFDAVHTADPNDEDFWLEFKADLDPSTKPGSAALAKAIVAFANRDSERAAERFGGHGLIVVGLAPGVLPGTVNQDPAHTHHAVERWITQPGPDWHAVTHTYQGKRVMVFVVGPPKSGDPIHCIGKATDNLNDGDIYVRRSGLSERAKGADVQRLSARLSGGGTASRLNVEVGAVTLGGVRRCTWPTDWLDRWVQAEERRLIAPMEEALNPPPPGAANPFAAVLSAPAFEAFAKFSMDLEENRTSEDYRRQVTKHISDCRDALTGVETLAMARVLPLAQFSATNPKDKNIEGLLVEVSFVDGVRLVESVDTFRLSWQRPAAPRPWGPRKRFEGPNGLETVRDWEGEAFWSHHVTSDDGAKAEFHLDNLRPGNTRALDDEHVILIPSEHRGPVELTWRATATNLDGVAEGRLALPVADDPLDLTEMLRHRHVSRSVVIRPGRPNSISEDGWERAS